MKMIATVCIPTTRSSDTLDNCMKSLEQQTNKEFSVLLITKDSIDIQITTTLSYKQIHQKRPGLVGAMNDALDKITTPITIRIDDDVTVDIDWFDAIIKSFSDKTVGGVTGPTIIPLEERGSRDLMKWISILEHTHNPLMLPLTWLYLNYIYEGNIRSVGKFLKSGAFTLGSNFPESKSVRQEIDVDHVEACNMAFRTDVLKELGGFDAIYTKGLGDYHEADISFKVLKKGYTIVFNPQAALYHHIGQGTAENRGEAYDRMRNFVRFYKRHLYTNSLDAWCRFGTNLLLQNAYFLYKFLTTGKADNLWAPFGTIVQLIKHE